MNNQPFKIKVMKPTKLMLSALAALSVLASCQKEENTRVNPDSTLGSVEIYVNNVVYTKGQAGDPIEDQTPVTLNSLRIFLTNEDLSAVYDAKLADGTPAQTYWDGSTDVTITELLSQKEPIRFHYIDPAVTKVIALGNVPESVKLTQVEGLLLKIGEQQNAQNLTLFAKSGLEKFSTETHDNGAVNNLYKASLTLVPRIARFEVDGFRVAFNNPAKFSEVEVLQLAIDNYMPETSLYTGIESGTLVDELKDAVLDVKNNSAVYDWFNRNTSTGIWWYDNFTSLSMTPSDPAKDLDQKLAYHIFAGNQKPQFIIRLLVDDVPAYIYTKNFKQGTLAGAEVTEFLEGYIYRMNAAGESGTGDGSIEIPEDKIDEMDRCLDISVEVHPWKVVIVAPEF